MADDEWSTSANDAINIAFLSVAQDGPQEVASFHPEYTEQQFGKDQSIFGYKDLSISLRFAAHDLYPNFSFKYGSKWKTVKDAKAADIEEIFKADLSPDALGSAESFTEYIQDKEKASSFRPPGQLVEEYSKDGRQFQIYSGELTDDSIRKVIERIQILVPFFIDGGISIPVDDPEWSLARWRVWFLYEKIANPVSPFSIVGYCTSYRFLPYQSRNAILGDDIEPSDFTLPGEGILLADLPNRSRISQFLILPHHQGQSHGRRLYENVVQTFLKDLACIEITVEDPNEQFDDLRDMCDYMRLSSNGTFSQIRLNLNLDPRLTARGSHAKVPTGKLLNKALLERLRVKNKLAPRQFKRLMEMHLLSQIPKYSREAGTARLIRKAASSDPGDKALYFWRLLVKQRIYNQHRELLKELETDEKHQKLDDTATTQWMDFERILAKLEKSGVDVGNTSSRRIGNSRGKRKIVDDDDDEDEDDSEDGAAPSSQASKRLKS